MHAPRQFVVLGLWCAALLPACGAREAGGADVDAGPTLIARVTLDAGGTRVTAVTALAQAHASSDAPRARAQGVLGAIRAHRPFADRLGASMKLAREGDRFHASRATSPSPWSVVGEHLDVSLPLHADGTTRLAIEGAPTVSLALTPLDVAHVQSELVDGALVAVDAVQAIATGDPAGAIDASRADDVVQLVDARGFEELRLVRTPPSLGAPHSPDAARVITRYRIERGPGVAALRLREGRVEALDREGVVRIATAPMVAFGADGAARALEVSLEADDVLRVELDPRGLALPIAIDPAWTATVSGMANGHTYGPALVLSTGKVLVLGGSAGPPADLYDPSTALFVATPPYAGTGPRDQPGGALLPGGDVLAGGGWGTSTGVTERYAPGTNTWATTATAAANVGVYVALASGLVLQVPTLSNKAQTYDASTGLWTDTGAFPSLKQNFEVTRLSSGKVLVTGGLANGSGAITSTADLYDPATRSFATASPMLVARTHHRTVLLGDGTVLVAGGANAAVVNVSTTEIYDPTTNKWTAGPPMLTPRAAFAFVPITGGFLAAGGGAAGGGGYISAAEIYDPTAKLWRAAAPMLTARSYAASTALPSTGGALIAGGLSVVGSSTAEVFTPRANGAPCVAGGDCTSTFCADGVCCNAACAGACQACDLVAAPGVCSAISGAPHAGHPTCGDALCKSGACVTSCASDAECAATAYCGGTCLPRKANGALCSAAKECTSGACADGVCCNVTCGGSCLACNLAGLSGTCSPRPATSACGALASCSGATLSPGGHCSGSDGTCTAAAASTCPGALKCANASSCLARCNSTADCATGTCSPVSGTCDGSVLDAGAGDSAVADSATADSASADSTTADSASADSGTPDTGTSVSDATTVDADGGQPTEKPNVTGTFVTCVRDGECASGHCSDGVCCDTACKEHCHTCILPGSPGKCVEAPVGVDLRGDCGAASQCLSTCGPGGACIGAGTGTLCARSRCLSASTGVGPAVCIRPGAACPSDEAVRFDCAPFACEPVFGACRNACTNTNDCAPGFLCDVGQRLCVAGAIPAASDAGGCSVEGSSAGATGGGEPWIAGGVVIAALGLARGARRRRRR
jgi:hypothetical protein